MSTQTAFFGKLFLLATISALVGSCAAYRDYLAKEPAAVQDVESQLAQAGFRKVPITTHRERTTVAQLRLHQLNQYQSTDGKVFWYADPTICKCLYEGDQAAYDRYTDLAQQQRETAEYAKAGRPQDVADLSPFGDAFPTPMQGWPMVIDLSASAPIGVAGGGAIGGAAINPAGGFGGMRMGGGGGGGRISRR